MVDPVKEFPQVHIHHHPSALGDVLLGRLYRLMGVPPRSEAVARFGEVRLKDRAQYLMQRLLDHPIRERRDAPCPHPALRLRDIHRAHRLGDVFPSQYLGLDRRPVLLQVIFELGHGDAIHSCRAFVLHHPLIRKLTVVAFAHGLHQPAWLRFGPPAGRHASLSTKHGFTDVLPRFHHVGIHLP